MKGGESNSHVAAAAIHSFMGMCCVITVQHLSLLSIFRNQSQSQTHLPNLAYFICNNTTGRC